MRKSIFISFIAAAFVLLFVYAATSKLIEFSKFEVQLGQSPMLTGISAIVAVAIPVIEIIPAGLLFFEKTRLAGLYVSFSLMVMFTAYIVAVTQFSDYIPCSCGGILQKMTWNQHLVFNIVFTCLALAGVMFYSHAQDSGKLLVDPGNG